MSRRSQRSPSVGTKFGDWEVIASSKKYHVLCRCKCGVERSVAYRTLYAGNSNSCLSCARRKHSMSDESKRKLSTNKIKHGHRIRGSKASLTYNSWQMMLARCNNKNFPEYKNYGARGITVCDRWLNFVDFLSDMRDRPSLDHSIEREDNDGNYELGNCRWATEKEQQRNKRSNRLITFDGKTQCVSAWAEEYGIGRHRITHRIDALGWSVENTMKFLKRRRSAPVLPKER